MVLNQEIVDSINNSALDEFDVISHMGFSDDGSNELASSDVLAGEFLRKALSVSSKDTAFFTYEFDALIGLTEANGETLQKLGVFTDLSGDTLKLSRLLEVVVAKTADREINVGYKLTVEVLDQTG